MSYKALQGQLGGHLGSFTNLGSEANNIFIGPYFDFLRPPLPTPVDLFWSEMVYTVVPKYHMFMLQLSLLGVLFRLT